MTEAQPNREMYGKTLAELGGNDPRIIVFEADVAKSTNTWRFRDRFPDRFFQLGTAELNMVCMAAGAAATGLVPFVSTFVVFASMRACEGVRTSIAYPKLNVKLVATNAGVEICGDGATHQGVEDIAIMRVFPNMTVLAPIGRMIPLRQGGDAAIIACGNMVEQALIAAETLARDRIEVRVLDCHTIKPIDREAILRATRETAGIVTAEDHFITGGLGSAVCEVVAEECPTMVRRVGLGDRFASSARDYRKLLDHFGLNAAAIEAEVRAIVQRRRGVV